MGPCDICGQLPQAMQIGNMNTGEQQFVCVPCFCRFGLDLAKQVLPPEEIAAQLGPMFVPPYREDLHEGAAQVRKGRKSKAAPETLAAEGTTGGPAEVPPAAPDK